MARLRPFVVALALTLAVSAGLIGSSATPAAALSTRLVDFAAEPAGALPTAGWLRFGGLGASGDDEISGPVFSWGCRGGELGRYAYLWGCAGANNRYLMGHASAEFEPLCDFVRVAGAAAGTRALVGMLVTWKTPSGDVERYRVSWARVASIDVWGRTGDLWAWNATAAPTLTFQTCYGARSEYRLIVRAVLVS